MKKILALVLVLMLGLSAMADTTEPTIAKDGANIINPTDQPAYSTQIGQSLTFNKVYTTVGESPAISFAFTAPAIVSYNNNNGTVVTEAAQLSAMANKPTVSLNYDAVTYTKGSYTADTGKTNIVASVAGVTGDTPVGVYKYSFNESVTTKMTGVTYDETVHYLYVTVMRNEDNKKYYVVTLHNNSDSKVTAINNSYATGTLNVTKQVTGNMADVNKYFKFEVQFTAASGTTLDTSAISVKLGGEQKTQTTGDITGGQGYTVANNKFTFYLKHNQTAELSNVPAGATYTVTEVPDGYTKTETYTTSKTGDNVTADKKIEANETETATFTNEKISTVDTGINLDTLPYVMLLALAIVGGIILIARKRRED